MPATLDLLILFSLRESALCFEAKVYFFADNISVQAFSEIHVVTIDGKGLDVLYILSTPIEPDGFPTMFVMGDFEVGFSLRAILLTIMILAAM